MAWTSRWTIISYDHEWIRYDKKLTIITNRRVHMRIHVGEAYPARRDEWTDHRGVHYRHRCDMHFKQKWAAWQVEAGETTTHTFWIRDWEFCQTQHWWFDGVTDGRLSPSESAIFSQHFSEVVPPLPPQPTPTRICWDVMNRILRCGNRYTFWANETWYAMIPTPTSLTMWKLVGVAFVRQDVAGEPSPANGVIADADSRQDTGDFSIHCSYFSNVGAPGPHELYWAVYSTDLDSWLLHELICNPTRTAWLIFQTSISLDLGNIPHVIYSDYSDGWPEFHYRNRTAFVWSPPEVAINRPNKAHQHCSAWHDTSDNSFHCMAGSSAAWQYLNRRTPLGVWDGLSWGLEAGLNLAMHSLWAEGGEAAFAAIGADWRVNYIEGVPPYAQDSDLTLANSQYPNVIVRPNPPNMIQIMYRNQNARLGFIWRTPGGIWSVELGDIQPVDSILTAMYAHPDVISCLWQQAGAAQVCFYALATSWV